MPRRAVFAGYESRHMIFVSVNQHIRIRQRLLFLQFAVEVDVAGEKQIKDGKMARVENHYSGCSVETEYAEGKGIIIQADPNTNLLHPMTRIPAVHYPIPLHTDNACCRQKP